MRKRIILAVVVLWLMGMQSELFAQNNKWHLTTHLGVSTALLDNGVGFQISLNPIRDVSERVALEGQLSFMSFRGTEFLSGGNISDNVSLALVGARYYFNNSEHNWQPYINFLIGGVNSTVEGQAVGGSVGAYLSYQRKFSVGVAFESSQYVFLKAGYTF